MGALELLRLRQQRQQQQVASEPVAVSQCHQQNTLVVIASDLLVKSDVNIANIPVCRCGYDRANLIPIHNGQSERADCARCGRFLAFTRW